MKTKAFLLALILVLNGINIIIHNPVARFLMDGRPKRVMYFNFSSKLIHIDIEVIEPVIQKKRAAYNSINIFFFLKDFDLMHTISWRYVDFIEA